MCILIIFKYKEKMKKVEYIAKYGLIAYKKQQAQTIKWKETHKMHLIVYNEEYHKEHHEVDVTRGHEISRKGGKYYKKRLEYSRTGLGGQRHRIRVKHGIMWRQYKCIIAPESEIHHEWVPGTSNYNGIALVEKTAHRYGIIDVIEILDGTITLLKEMNIRERK